MPPSGTAGMIRGMRATCWMGKHDIQVKNVPDPRIEAPTDALVRVTLTAICGSDLHIYNGLLNPVMEHGDVLGHEFMGEVIEVGKEVSTLKKGDRVVTAFAISCGNCWFCERKLFSCCDVTNRDRAKAESLYGMSGAGMFGYSHAFGHYAGGQAEVVRVPHADVGCLVLPEQFADKGQDEKALFLSDILPTAWMAVENCEIQPGATVAVFGAGPVGQLCVASARAQGAGRVIAVDRVPERLAMAKSKAGADTVIDYSGDSDVVEAIKELTNGRGADACIDSVGTEADATGIMDFVDRAKQKLKLESDRPQALRWAIQSCRKAGVVSIPGVYAGTVDMLNFGSAFAKGVTMRMGQTHVQRYMVPLLAKVEKGELDPSFVITHRLGLDDAPKGYETFNSKEQGCVKVVMRP
jgi:threonine dehydrogenase-like Zn-dependent dehydrogenase